MLRRRLKLQFAPAPGPFGGRRQSDLKVVMVRVLNPGFFQAGSPMVTQCDTGFGMVRRNRADEVKQASKIRSILKLKETSVSAHMYAPDKPTSLQKQGQSL